MARAYVICDISVTDAAAYEEYKRLSASAVEQYGGRYLVRGGDVTVFEGEWRPGRVVVLEFDSLEAAHRWYDSPEYTRARGARQAAATASFVLVPGA